MKCFEYDICRNILFLFLGNQDYLNKEKIDKDKFKSEIISQRMDR